MKYINKILLIVVASGSFLSFNKSIANGSKNNASCEDLNNYSIRVRGELEKVNEYISHIEVFLSRQIYFYENLLKESSTLESVLDFVPVSKSNLSFLKETNAEIINVMEGFNNIFRLINIKDNKSNEDVYKKIQDERSRIEKSIKKIKEINDFKMKDEMKYSFQKKKGNVKTLVDSENKVFEEQNKMIKKDIHDQTEIFKARLEKRSAIIKQKKADSTLKKFQSAPNLGNSRRSPLQSQENPEGQSTLMQKSASSVQLKNPQQ
ncbi:hypothetical protein HE1_00405 [Holospora elegans E1]|uniref:Uncharacterized protein n=2 Tax=Holospora TaxID=44747 RepID=A0A023DY16_9PROT|nr:hypothetical protein HE1_00405 [Holospora elegans E1]